MPIAPNNIAHELRNAVRSALDNGGAFDLRKLSPETARALGKADYNIALKAILGACAKDAQLWARVSPLLQNPLTKMALVEGAKEMHSELKRGS
jgi:hypothetical protein